MAYSYNVYVLSNLLPPLFASVVLVLISFIAVIFVIGFLSYKLYQDEEVEVPCLSGMYAAVSFLFKDAIKKEGVGRNVEYVLFNRRIHPIFIPLLFLIVPGFLACISTSFWGVYLSDESFTCDPDLDCFPFSADNENLQDDPIVNCTDFGMSDNITIICYHFVFNSAIATGLAGGLLSFIAAAIQVFGAVLVWGMNLDEEDEHCCCKVLKKCVVSALAFLPGVGSLIAVIVVHSVPFFSNAILETPQRSLQFHAYLLTTGYLGLLVPPLFLALALSDPYE